MFRVELSREQFALRPDSRSYFTRHRHGAHTYVTHHKDPSCLRGREGVHPEQGGEVVTRTAPVEWTNSWPCPDCYPVHVPPPRHAPPRNQSLKSPMSRMKAHFDVMDPERLKTPSMVGVRSAYNRHLQGEKLSNETAKMVLRALGDE